MAHIRVSASGLPLVRGPLPAALLLRIAWLACASAAAVPEVAITSETRRAPETPLRLAQLARNKLLQPRQLFLRRWIAGKKFLGQADRAQRQAHRFPDAFALRERDLATAAADVDQQASALRAGFAHHPTVDQARLFQAGDDLHFPTGLGLDPGDKGLRIARVAQRRGGYRAHPVGAVQLDRSIKTLQRQQCARHGFGRDHAAFEHARSQPRYLAVLVQHFQLVLLDSRDL